MPDIRAVATDAVIFINDQVVLLERDHSPYEGHWVLPGGLVEPDETTREACVREAHEEVGLRVDIIESIGVFDDPDRDERGNISIAYRCRPIHEQSPRAKEEAKQVDVFDPTDLPQMGFDHEQIITTALRKR
ncbi:MAG: NUDIX domain-containing protein [Halobacteriaceae archaeon]